MLARLSIRAKLTAAFALAMLLILALAAVFVYLQVQDNLGEALDEPEGEPSPFLSASFPLLAADELISKSNF